MNRGKVAIVLWAAAALFCVSAVGCGVFGGGENKNPDGDKTDYTEGLEYALSADGKCYSVTGLGNAEDVHIVIPASYKNLPVVAIGDYAFAAAGVRTGEESEISFRYAYADEVSAGDIESVSLPDSVTTIGRSAFYGCEKMESVTLGNGVVTIAESAFSGCASLESVVLPESVEEVGAGAFENCAGLKEITLPEGVQLLGEGVFRGCEQLTDIYYGGSEEQWKEISKGKEWEEESKDFNIEFGGKQDDEEEENPPHVHAFGEWSVAEEPTCTEEGLRIRTCECGLDETEELPALDHDLRENVTPATCTEEGCTAITCTRCDYSEKTTTPALNHDMRNAEGKEATCTESGWEAYEYCTRCNYSTKKEIPAYEHDFVEEEEPATCTEDGYRKVTCTRCDYLDEQVLPARGYHVFGEWSVAEEPTCTEEGLRIRTCECGLDETEELPMLSHHFTDGFCEVCGEPDPDYEMPTLQYLQFVLCTEGDTEFYAAYLETALHDRELEIVIPATHEGVPVKRVFGFANSELKSVTLPASISEIGESAFERAAMQIIFADGGKGISIIGNNAFNGFYGENLTIPAGATHIGDYAYCEVAISGGLRNLTIPDGVTEIGAGAFIHCADVESLTLSKNLKTIGESTFFGCKTLEDVYIPDGVTAIGAQAFAGGSIQRLRLPASLTDLSPDAFENDWIRNVVYGGTVEQWKALGAVLGNLSEELYVVQCTDGAVDSNGNPVENVEHVHIFGAWTMDKEPTCTEKGRRSRSCYCGEIVNEETEALGHSVEWTVVTRPTCTESGLRRGVCSRCGEEREEILPAGHAYNYETVSLPTCTEDGLTVAICTVCGHREEITQPAYGHSPYTDRMEPTCTMEGYERIYCTNCGSTIEERTLPMTEHSPYTEIIMPSTCNVEGLERTCCMLCGNTLEEKTLPMAEHVYADGVCVNCGVADPNAPIVPEEKSLEYTLSEDGEYYIVTGIGTIDCMELSTVAVLSEYNGLPVREIGAGAFQDSRYSFFLELPDSITAIGDNAFSCCDQLHEVRFGSGLKTIGEYAFSGTALSRLTLPSSLVSLGNGAFFGCSNLSSINLNDGLLTIGDCAFMNCYRITEVTVPDSVQAIGNQAFDLVGSGWVSITLGSGLQTIGERAFSGIDEIRWNNPAIETIGDYAFCGFRGMYFEIPSSVKEIGRSAFSECYNIQTFIVPDGVTKIGQEAFSCQQLTSVSIPASLTELDLSSFSAGSSSFTLVFRGTVEQFNALTHYTAGYPVQCSDGVIEPNGNIV